MVYATIAASLGGLLILLIAMNHWWKGFLDVHRAHVTQLGLVRIPLQALTLYKTTAEVAHFPSELEKFMKRQLPREAASLSLQYIQQLQRIEQEPEMLKRMTQLLNLTDIKRAITIAAAVYKQDLPLHLVQIDSRTRELYHAWYKQNELIEVASLVARDPHEKVFHVGNSAALTEMTLAKYTARALIVGSVLTHYQQQGSYPSFEIFAETLRLNIKRKQRKDIEEGSYSTDELKIMTTAYAAVTDVKLPRSYVLVNPTTHALAKRMVRRSPLSSVSSKQEAFVQVVEK